MKRTIFFLLLGAQMMSVAMASSSAQFWNNLLVAFLVINWLSAKSIFRS